MTVEDQRFHKQRVFALDDFAAPLMAALVVDGAVLDAGLVLRHVTAGFANRFGPDSAQGLCLLDLIENADQRARLTAMAQALGAHHNAASLPQEFREGVCPNPDETETAIAALALNEIKFIEARLSRPAMDVRISPLTSPDHAGFGFLVQEIFHTGLSDIPQQNANRVAPSARAKAQTVLTQLTHAYWESNPVTGQFFASALYYKMRGYQVSDAHDEKHEVWKERVHPEDRAAVFDYQRKLQTGEADFMPVIYRERHADGHWITILCKGAVIERDERGAVLRVAGIDADITGTPSTEDYIRSIALLEQRWLIAAEYGQLGLWDNDELAGTRYVSQTWRKMRGFSPDDAFDESREGLLARTHPDDRAALERQIAATVTGKTEVVVQEYREKHKDGHYIWILSRGQVMARDAQGRATRIIGIDTDITEIKASSEKIYRMSQRLEVAIQATRVGIWDADFAKNEVIWDERMMKIYGLDLPPGPIPDNFWENALHPEDKARVLAQTDDVTAGKIAFADDYRIIRTDGTVRYIRSRSTELFDGEDGHGLIGVNWDVTADVEAACALSRANSLARQRNDELEQARAEMEYNALHDALTDLPNRRFLDRQMRALHGQTRQIAIMQLDLDRFKQINDTIGHAAGDAVLRHVARVMVGIVPDDATLARVGGDEFVILFEAAATMPFLTQLAEQIASALNAPFTVNGKPCRFGVSIGIATGQLPDLSPEQIFENADMALYEAKDSGRGRSVFFSKQMRTAVESKRLLADAILGGLERDEFFCVYQPQFEAGSLHLSGVEALIRWQRPDGTVAAPCVFLEMAEELGVVDLLDHKVLEQVIADQARWSTMGLPVPRVSVNVSGRRLADQDLPRLLEILHIRSGQIAFELLETMFLDTHNPIIAANIAAIRAMGIEIEIDDFGTGHASIVGMLQLQPDRLKIDQQIVRMLTEGEKQARLVRTIIDIGQMHDIEVIAEGVETPDHLRLLTNMGCNFVQGFGLGMPMSEPELRARLRSGCWDLPITA